MSLLRVQYILERQYKMIIFLHINKDIIKKYGGIYMVLLSELQVKEVILMDSGKRLGFIQDVNINKETGTIDSFVIVDRQMRGAFFQKQEEKLIDWKQIVTIGADIILVQQTEKTKNEVKIEEKIEKE